MGDNEYEDYDLWGKSEEKFVLRLSVYNRQKSSVQYSERPLWNCIDEALDLIYNSGGTVSIEFLKPESAYIEKLFIDALPQHYRLVLFTKDKDPKKRIYEYWQPGDDKFRGNVQFTYDDEWDARTILSDLSVAKAVFKDVFETQEVSPENMRDFRSEWDPKS